MNSYGDYPLFTKIKNLYPSMSKSHRKIADYILENYDRAGFMTALKLGETTGVSESTAVRFAYELGFEGYPEFQKELAETAKRKLTFIQRINLAEDRVKDGNMLQRVADLDIASIRSTMGNVSKEDFYAVVDLLVSARKVYVMGSRSAEPLAVFLYYYLNLMLDEVVNVKSSEPAEVLQQVLKVDQRDVIVGISFPRYSSQTLKVLQYASDRNAKVVAITDSHTSPIAKVATYTLLAKSNMSSFIDTLTAPLSVLNALLMAISIIKKDELSQTFSTLENIWDEYDVYDKSEEL